MTTVQSRARGPRRDAAHNREALIRAAATLLNRDPSASLDAIAAEAKLSRRAFYGHFATRDALLREVALQGAERVNAAVLSEPSKDESPDRGLQLALLGMRLWNEVDQVRTMALIALRGSEQQSVVKVLDPLRARVRRILAGGVADGRFRTDIDVDRLTRLVESAAIAVLDEGVRHELSYDEGARLVALSVLAIAGLGHREASLIVDDAAGSTPSGPSLPTTSARELPGS